MNIRRHSKIKVPIVQNVLKVNDKIAADNNALFAEKGLLAINMMSSPGAGKTTLIENTIEALKNELTIAVIEGDIQTTYDAERVSATARGELRIRLR